MNEIYTKEEREALLNRKMEDIRRKNEQLKKRHQEIQADKERAEKEGRMVSVRAGAASPPPAAHSEMRGVTPPNDKPSRMAQGRGKRLSAMTKKEDNTPPNNVPPKKQGQSHPSQQGYTPPKFRQKNEDANKNTPNSGDAASKLSQGRGKRLSKMGKDESNQSNEGPPPEPGYSFLQDRSREGPLPENTRGSGTPRHPRNFGGHDLSQVKMRIKKDHNVQNRHSVPANNKWELEMKMTGKERKEYQDWKMERERIDSERLNRQKNASGDWRREWDVEKKDGGKPAPRRKQEEGFVAVSSGSGGQPAEDWDVDDTSPTLLVVNSQRNRPPSPPQSRRTEPARRPAGRIGSGRFALDDVEAAADTLAAAAPKVAGGSGRFLDRSDPAVAGGDRGRGQWQRGGGGGKPYRGSYHEDEQRRPRYTSHDSAGSDDATRCVEEHNDRLVIQITNDTPADRPDFGGNWSRGGRGRGGGSRGGRGGDRGVRGGRGGARGQHDYHQGGRGQDYQQGGRGGAGSWRGSGRGGAASQQQGRQDGVVMRRWENEEDDALDPGLSDGGRAEAAKGKRPRGRKQHRPLSYTEGYTFATITTGPGSEQAITEASDEKLVSSPRSQESKGSHGGENEKSKEWEGNEQDTEKAWGKVGEKEKSGVKGSKESKTKIGAEEQTQEADDDDEWEDAEETVEYGDNDTTEEQETVDVEDVHNSSAESFDRFIEEHTLDIDIHTGTVQKKSSRDKTPDLPKLKTEKTPPSGGKSNPLSPMSPYSNMFAKTPEGFEHVLDWGADVQAEFGDMLSPEYRKSLGLPSPDIDHETAQKLDMSLSSSEAESPMKKDLSSGDLNAESTNSSSAVKKNIESKFNEPVDSNVDNSKLEESGTKEDNSESDVAAAACEAQINNDVENSTQSASKSDDDVDASNNSSTKESTISADKIESNDDDVDGSDSSTAKDFSGADHTIESDPVSSESMSLADELAQSSKDEHTESPAADQVLEEGDSKDGGSSQVAGPQTTAAAADSADGGQTAENSS